MAEGVVGRNMTFPIFNSDGTPFNDLVLHKATYDTVVMSLGDKITGDVYYKDNTLAVTMGEYIEFKQNPNDASEQATKFILVNPPTVVKEGMVSDNSELRGMTKYSFTFYHPMCLLANFPFSDVAVTNDQKRYLSENKSFSWIGTMEDYVAKLNKNLEGTQWIVVINTSSVAQEDRTKLSDVMTFDNQSIADALKTGYETWKVPYVVDVVKSGEVSYSSGKRFKVMFGLPTTEIRRNSVPFVFKYGQGVGLKNNSRTPRNNKIVTRIAGYGSEDNIPYGYPQIIWTGNQSWDYTINNDSTASNSYPIYDGIVGGQKVRLIKHPFTRTHLMPSVYIESLNRKVNPNATGYDPTEELVDYYDADNTYENPINPSSPSYEIHEFGDIKPELGDRQLVSVATYDTNSDKAISMSDFIELVDKYYSESENEDEKTALVNLKESIQENESDSGSQNIPGQIAYNYWWDFYTEGAFIFVTYSSTRLNFTSTVLTGEVIIPSWDDTMDDDGNYVQSYFKVTLPALGFDLYACAAITQEMKINMRSGACMGCSFDVAVDWDVYKANFYDEQGNFDPAIGTGHRRDADLFPDSTSQQITLVVKKDIDTFGTLMPNIYQQPAANDKFVIIGISLPTSYITSAQTRLDDDMKQYMRDNNVYYYDYPLKFDEYFLAQNTNILTQMKPNIIVYFEYAGVQLSLYIKQMTVKYGDKPLPEYNITLTDDVEIVLNQIGQVTSEVSNLRVLMEQNGFGGNVPLEETDKRYLRKDADDTAAGLIRMIRGMQVGERFVTGLLGEGGIFRKDADGKTYLECDRMYVRMKAYFDTVEVRRFIHSGGNRIASAAGMKCSRVEYITSNGEVTDDASLASKFRCYFRAGDNGTEITNDFVVNDLAYCKETNIAGEQQASVNTAATRSVSASRSASEENITISLTITNNTSAPVTLDGDVVFVLSNPDIDGNYHGWEGSYNRTGHLRFSNSAVTLAANESRTVSVSGELYRRNPANDSEIADAGRRSNVLLYVGGNSEIAICSNMSHSIVFQNGGAYNVSISQIRQGAVQRFYWRKVIGVSSAVNENGEHYIDLSKTDCATGSDIPIAQDDIIQLGNTTDNSRQGAIIEYVSGEDAPSYQIYQEINSYSLEAKNYVRLGYDSESGGAQAYIGNPDGSTYLWYHLVTEDNVTFPRLDIKANVEFSSPDPTYGTETLDDFIAAITQNVENIQDQVDGNIESWFYDYMPVEESGGAPLNQTPLVWLDQQHTVPCLPYKTWYDTDVIAGNNNERIKHLGDTFYDNSTGYAFRFSNTGTEQSPVFAWVEITDSAVIKALADAARAQDTADHKRRSFVLPVTIEGVTYNYPFPPYDVGDLWLNAKYPYDYNGATDADHNKYNNDVLRCVTSQGESGSFSIAHWVLASKYTDDTVVNDFIDNTYAPFVQDIQNQVDKKAETWYQDSDPSTAWNTAELKEIHVGDIWCDTSAGGGKKTYIYKDFGTSANPRYAWAEQAVPDAVFDTIDGKCAIYTSWNGWIDANNVNNLQVKDLLIPQADISQTIGGITYNYVANKVYRCTDTSIPVFREIEYTDDTTVNNIISRYGQILNIQNPTATNVGEALAYLREVLGGNTTIDGGLILSHMIALKNGSQIMAGMNGTLIGNSLSTPAAWYGGAMVDYEALTDAQRAQGWNVQHWAMSLFRFNGTGYLAGGNISWNADGSGSVAGGNLSWSANGEVTLQGVSVNATTLQKGGYSVATESQLSDYLPLSAGSGKMLTGDLYSQNIVPKTTATYVLGSQSLWWSSLFVNKIYLYKPNANNDTNAVYFEMDGSSTVKLVGNFYATGAVSALGSNSGGGGSSPISLNNLLNSMNQSSVAAPSASGVAAVYNGSSWVYSNTSGVGLSVGGNLTVGGSANIGSITTASVTSAGGFVKSGSNNDYVLLAGGGTAALSSIAGSSDRLTSINYPDDTYSLFLKIGQPIIGTADGNAYAGSSPNYKLWSFPQGSTSTDGTYANVQTLRIFWGAEYFHDIFTSPNNHSIFHRYVNAGTAYDWNIIPQCTYTQGFSGVGSASQPVYVDSNGNIVAANSYSLDNIQDGTTRKLANYLPLSGGTMTGNISWNSDSHGIYLYGGCGIEKWSGYGPSLVAEGNSLNFWIRNGTDRSDNALIIHSKNIGSQSVSYANSAGSVDWSNVSGRPSAISSFSNDVGYITSSGSCAYASNSNSANILSTYAADGNDNLSCLQGIFNSLPKSVGTAVRLQHGSHAMAFGWFLDGYGYSNAYGGWFISDYDTPVWVGVSNGSWNTQTFITSRNIGSQSVAYASSADMLDGEHASAFLRTDLTCIELNQTGALSGYGGFIDFHYNGSSADYTSRIIEDASGRINVNGTFFTTNAISNVNSIDSILNFNTSLAALGIRNVESSDSESYPLIINGNTWICPTIASKTTLNILGQMTLRSPASTTYKMQFGTYTNTYEPFINFYDSTGASRNVLELYTETSSTGRAEKLYVGRGFGVLEKDGNGNTTLLGRTYIFGANIHFMVNDSTSSASNTRVQAMRMYVNGKTWVGTESENTSFKNLNNNAGLSCALNAYTAQVCKLYVYKPYKDNDTNAVWFEYDSTNGSVKLNGSFYATGGVSALGVVGSGGGSSVTLGNVLTHIKNHDATSFSPSTNSVLLFRSGVWGSMTLTQLGASVTTDCVKTSNNQTVGGDKTFSGVTSFTGGVTLVSNITPSVTNQYGLGTSDKRFANVYATNGNFSGTLTAGTLSFTSLSLSGTLSVGSTATAVSFIASGYNSTYVLLSGSIKALSDFVQTSGNQDVAGNKKFTGSTTFSGTATFNADASFAGGITLASSLKPNQNEQYGLGTSDKRFSSLYVKDANISGALTVGTFSPTNLSISGKSLLSGGVKAYTLCVECGSNGDVDMQYSGEINRFDSKDIHLQYRSTTGGVTLCYGGNGTVAINAQLNTTTKAYKLYVNGTSYFSNDLAIRSITFSQGSWSGSPASDVQKLSTNNKSFAVNVGTGSAFVSKNWSTGSDMRLKDIVAYIDNLTVESVASAPVFKFTWKDSEAKEIAIGTSAQYWRNVLPNAVTGNDNSFLALDYNAVTIASVVATARKVVDHEHRIQQLEWENERLRKEIETLKAA